MQPHPGVHYPSPLQERARRQLDTYWRVRVAKTIESLEREARRMFQLEAQLTRFAEEYISAVGPWADYLAALDAQFEAPLAEANEDREALALALTQRSQNAARAEELKTRYRTLAKEMHPDRQGDVSQEMSSDIAGERAEKMRALNAAYAATDLAALLKCEAEILMMQLCEDWSLAEVHLRDMERAVETYASGYRQLLNAPLNHLMLRSLSAQQSGWDFIGSAIQRFQRGIAVREETLRGSADIAVA